MIQKVLLCFVVVLKSYFLSLSDAVIRHISATPKAMPVKIPIRK